MFVQFICLFMVAASGAVASSAALGNQAQRILQLQNQIIAIGQSYVERQEIPYVWGGSQAGEPKTCKACRACVKTKKVSLKNRLQQCAACRSCGFDCSHFVNKVLNEAGLVTGYASSRVLLSGSPRDLLRNYSLVDVGKDLTLAQPGDILVFPGHVALLAKVRSASSGDFMHATRFENGDTWRLGGIKYERQKNIARFRHKLRRILRHKDLFLDHFLFSELYQKVSDQT